MLGAAGVVVAIYAAVQLALTGVATWVETRAEVYPWKDEDPLRYLLPTLFDERGGDRILIMGPSEAREDLLYSRFDEAFPHLRAFQGALSLGKLDDTILTLEYLEGAYGADAMPLVLVMGITPRFVGNLPRDISLMSVAINRYSPLYRVESTDGGSQVAAKTVWQGMAGRVRFSFKQQKRHHAALCSVLLWWTGADERDSASSGVLSGVLSGVIQKLRFYRSPYKYHHLRPLRHETITRWLNDPYGFWHAVHAWNPSDDASRIREDVRRLREIARQHGIALFVVNLPEHPENRAGYRPGRYERYLELLQESLGDTPFLNLRDMLSDAEFYDVGHATLAGATRVTDRVIDFIKTEVDELSEARIAKVKPP